MSKADELLRELVDAQHAYAGAGPRIDDRTNAQRLQQALNAAHVYLNEKPHEPTGHGTSGWYPDSETNRQGLAAEAIQRASPPHAAAEPEKPVAWMYENTWGQCETVPAKKRWAAHVGWTETPLYASPSAQPIARDDFIRVDLTKPEDYQRLEAEVMVLRKAIVLMCECVKSGEGATIISYMEMFKEDPGVADAITTVQIVLAGTSG